MEEIITDTVDNGVIENVQIAPIGEYVGSDAKGNPIPEKIDAESLQKIADGLNSTDTEVLADIDHNASKPGVDKDTKAAGWFHKFIVDPLRGLFATLKLTKHGKELLQNREYRYISPTFKLDKDGKPIELHTASLTNLPAFQGYIDPILNTESNMETITMELTIEQLKELIKETIADLKKDEAVKEVEQQIKNENEVHEDIVENLEDKKEEKKEEVIKIEALNSAPTALKDVSGSDNWSNLHGEQFWSYLRDHPELTH